VDYLNRTGDAVEFTVDVPSAGTYALDFHYANGGSSPRATGLSLNAAAPAAGVSFAPTGSWRAWSVATVSVPLASGANKVRLLATGQSGPNLDSLTVRPLAPAVIHQAESALLSGALALSDVPDFTGTGFADYQHSAGDFVEFTINVLAAGTYALDFRYANGGTYDRPLDLSVDGQVLTGRLSFAPTGTWRTWNSATRSVLLSAGRHTVRLTAAGLSGPNLDALTIRPAAVQ
jgi:hypothetical protein